MRFFDGVKKCAASPLSVLFARLIFDVPRLEHVLADLSRISRFSVIPARIKSFQPCLSVCLP